MAEEELSDESEDEEREMEEIAIPVFNSNGEPICNVNLVGQIPDPNVMLTFDQGADDAPATFYVRNGSDATQNSGQSYIDLPCTFTNEGQILAHQAANGTGVIDLPYTLTHSGQLLAHQAANAPYSSAFAGTTQGFLDPPYHLTDQGQLIAHQAANGPSCSASATSTAGPSQAPSCSATATAGPSQAKPASKSKRQRSLGLQKSVQRQKKSSAPVQSAAPPDQTPMSSTSAAATPVVTVAEALTPPMAPPATTGTPVSTPRPDSRRARSARQSLPYTDGSSQLRSRYCDNKQKTELYCRALTSEMAHWDRMVDIDTLEVALKRERIELCQLQIKKLKRELGEE